MKYAPTFSPSLHILLKNVIIAKQTRNTPSCSRKYDMMLYTKKFLDFIPQERGEKASAPRYDGRYRCVTYRVFIKYCAFSKILKYIPDSGLYRFPLAVSVCTQ